MKHNGIYKKGLLRPACREKPRQAWLAMTAVSLRVLAMTVTMYLFISSYAYAAQYGILSETYVYPDGLRLDTDSKLFVWANWWNGVPTLIMSDDAADKREGEKSTKGVVNSTWLGFAVVWNPNLDSIPDPKNMASPVDYRNGSLNFWVKTEVPLRIGIRDNLAVEQWVSLSNYGVVADNQWRFVSIPFTDFSGIDFSQVTELFRVLNASAVSPGKTFHFDNVRWNTANVGALHHLDVLPSSWTLPAGLGKGFVAKGYDINNNERDIYPAWSVSGITGAFSPSQGAATIFTPASASGSGAVWATEGAFYDTSNVSIQSITWNDFFNLFIDKGMYGSLGAYDSDNGNADGDGVENNSITLATVTDTYPPGYTKSLRAVYSITLTGWAGCFLQGKKGLLVNPDVEIGNAAPNGWVTIRNDLTNETGWVTEASHSPTHSLKIVNTTGADAAWFTPYIYSFSPPYPTAFRFYGWGKAQDVSASTIVFSIAIWVSFTDGTSAWRATDIGFAKGTHDWQYAESTYDFGKAVNGLAGYCHLSGGTGTAWFDDINVELTAAAPIDLSQFANGYLHFWVKSPVDLEVGMRTANIAAGTEKSKVRLSEYGILAENIWREVYIALDDFKRRDERIDFTQLDVFVNTAVVGKYTGASSGIFYLSDIKYVRNKAATPTLTVAIKRRTDNQNEPLGKITYSSAQLNGGWELADQYLSIAYDTATPSWGAQVYTDNMGQGASPSYGGDPTKDPGQQPTGLIGVSERILNCPMAWLALDDVNTNVPRPVEAGGGRYFDSDTNGMWGSAPALSEWSWLKDKSSTKWTDSNKNDFVDVDAGEITADFSLTGDVYSTFIEPAGIATGWFIPPDYVTRVYILNPQSPLAIYLAAKFTKASVLQEYKTNTLTLELYHY